MDGSEKMEAPTQEAGSDRNDDNSERQGAEPIVNALASQQSENDAHSPREDQVVATSPIQTPHKPIPCFGPSNDSDQGQAQLVFPKLKSPTTQVSDPMALTHSSR
jgi:hypothetical protein